MEKALRSFGPTALIMFFGVLEPTACFGTPFKCDAITAIADAIPWLLLGVLFGRLGHEAGNERPALRPRAPSMLWVAVFFVAGRYFSYSVLHIVSGFVDRAEGTFAWTLGAGLAMGAFCWLAGSPLATEKPSGTAFRVGVLTLGTYWLMDNLFYALMFEVSIPDLILRSAADALYLFSAIFSFESVFGKRADA
jgi:hypothetical protein